MTRMRIAKYNNAEYRNSHANKIISLRMQVVIGMVKLKSNIIVRIVTKDNNYSELRVLMMAEEDLPCFLVVYGS